jgi:hypothetical protein
MLLGTEIEHQQRNKKRECEFHAGNFGKKQGQQRKVFVKAKNRISLNLLLAFIAH